MSFENWLANLESYPWWNTRREWSKTEVEGAWFIKPEDADGSFLVDTTSDTLEVFPPRSYTINDSWPEEKWWLEEGQPVSVDQLGKWLFLYGLSGLHLPEPDSTLPQEIWVVLQGGWSTAVMPPKKKRFWHRAEESIAPIPEPKDFREYLAQSIGVTELDLYVFSCLLDSYNLGFALIPSRGVIDTYEMSDLQAATAEPASVVVSHSPSSNLRVVGVGVTSSSFGVSGTGGSHNLEDGWYAETLTVINKPFVTSKSFLEALDLATRWNREPRWKSGWVSEPLENIRSYLSSEQAIEHFQMLADAGYAVAIIPLGGRTIWRPAS